MTLPRLPITKSMHALLLAATGKPVGLGSLPRVQAPGAPEHGTPEEPPYSVLYVVAGADYSGPPFADDHADAEWVYQVTCVAQRLDQALWLRDRVHAAVLGRDSADEQQFAFPLVVAGMTVTRRRFVSDGTPDTDDDFPSLFEQYAITVTRS